MRKGKFVDLVIGGPDMSGTSTQVEDMMRYFENKGMFVRDIRGTEVDALFHVSLFEGINSGLKSFEKFREKSWITDNSEAITNFYGATTGLLFGAGTNQDLRVASMVENDVTTYVNPDSADVWVMEEPTKRGAGQVCRVIEQNRSKFGGVINPTAAAEAHSVYRTDEFLRFREPLREKGKIIVRSRSEESGCYQIFDEKSLPNGVSRDYYLNLSGHNVAFANPPSDIFVVCGSGNWTERDYLDLKRERSGKDRTEDDHEADAGYQVLVNRRYATDWLEGLYEEGCGRFGAAVPRITRFSIYDSKAEIREKMNSKLEEIMESRDCE